MKFTTFALTFATLATLASAGDFSLRATANRLIGAASSDSSDARVIIHGLVTDASAEDIKIIVKSAVKAYNSAYSVTGNSITDMKATSSFPILSDNLSQWWNNHHCR
jgi:hypothetical protein